MAKTHTINHRQSPRLRLSDPLFFFFFCCWYIHVLTKGQNKTSVPSPMPETLVNTPCLLIYRKKPNILYLPVARDRKTLSKTLVFTFDSSFSILFEEFILGAHAFCCSRFKEHFCHHNILDGHANGIKNGDFFIIFPAWFFT